MSEPRPRTPKVRTVRVPPSAVPPNAAAPGLTIPLQPFQRDIGQLDRAVNDLRRRAPDFSAASPLLLWQRASLFLALSALSAGLVLLDDFGAVLWSLTIAVPFLMISVLRLAALWDALRRPAERQDPRWLDRRFDDRLPTFSVLVPLYREVSVVPGLVAAMGRLDYPNDRLEILFITEADDVETRQALLRRGLRANMRVVTVPPGQPKTKPRALNYALQDARGTLVAVFDAEDQPDADQLRLAALAFVRGGPRLACAQARLAISNANDCFLSRQFALEYGALFGGLLPALDHLGLPIPLGGTSNHFRRDVLLKSGGWDPFNVTEDADLGIRLARLGYQVSVIDSQTMEEAPVRWKVWLGQRTRWIKGWMQTYLVHMRRPWRLWRDLGAWRFTGLQVTISAMLISMLAHPWFYVLVGMQTALGRNVLPENQLLYFVFVGDLIAGYVTAALLILVTSSNARLPGRLISVLLLPVYWLAISVAAYRAIVDLALRPFFWEKTMHGVRSLSSDLRRRRA
ncbi:MAG: glycosyltransferase [Hyphomicrobium sp.]|uniref:glycosyltransferase n=1 Tax=Hyphomicrobium sp. TaxID=82 RepID=UPI0039E2B1FC